METRTLVAGRYRLDELIAFGGMGAVWRAFDPHLERAVAVKILHQGLSDGAGSGDRFSREARILAGLKGPGLVEVYDYGEDDSGAGGLRYIVMELIEGRTLTSLLEERGRLTVEEVMRYTAAAAEALDAAHERGVVHRDIKPGNLLIEPDGSLRLVDFGISLDENRARLTSPDGVLGTPSYVSPEQLNGSKVRRFADFYSLGAVAYECLTGSPPFTSDEPLAIVHMHLFDEAPPLPEDVPHRVAAVVERCLRKSPDERWRSGAELAAACFAAIDSAAPARRRDSRALAVLAAAVPVLLAVLIAAVWRPWTVSPSGSEQPLEQLVFSTETASTSDILAGEAATDDGTEPADGGDRRGGAESADPSEEPSESDSPESPSGGDPVETGAELPSVIGMEATEAEALLRSLGFENVATNATLLVAPGSAPDGCEIVSQDPRGHQWVEYERQIRITVYGLNGCP